MHMFDIVDGNVENSQFDTTVCKEMDLGRSAQELVLRQ